MANDEDFDKLQSGRDEWNSWISLNPNKRIDLSNKKFRASNFEGYIFPAFSDFSHSRFTMDAVFGNTTFLGSAKFISTEFASSANFRSSQFKDVEFDGSNFSGDVDLREAIFEGVSSFSGCNFLRNVIAHELR